MALFIHSRDLDRPDCMNILYMIIVTEKCREKAKESTATLLPDLSRKILSS